MKLQNEKRLLEEEIQTFNESRQLLTKYDVQMNDILQMVNEEKIVRGHLKTLASKLVDEVDTLRTQANNANSSASTPHNQLQQNTATTTSITNGTSSTAWKNRCSERRDRINIQTMQIALDKELQAKSQLVDENNGLKLELDTRSHRIQELQNHIDSLNKDITAHKMEIKDLQQQHTQQQLNETTTATTIERNQSSPNNLTTSQITDKQNNTTTNNNNNNNNNNDDDISMTVTTSISSDSNHYLHHQHQQQQPNQIAPKKMPSTTTPIINEHKFDVVSFNTIERCEYCCGIMYGICRQAVRCKDKKCGYLCHPKCLQYLPVECPININQRVKLKGVDFNKGIGTLMQGHLKIPKPGGVKKGWIDHYVFLSNARLFVCPIIDNRPSLIPVQIIDIRDTQFSVSTVNETDVIHASKKDLPCIFKMFVSKLKNPPVKQQLLFCAKDEKDRNNWINVLHDLNGRLVNNGPVVSTSNGSSSSASASASSSSTSSSTTSSPNKLNPTTTLIPIEAKEICDATTIRNAISACVYDSERLLIASEDGIDVIDIKSNCTIQRFHDKKSYLIDVFREEKLIIAISGRQHQIYLFPTIVIEGISADTIKIDDTKGCNLFCIGKLSTTSLTSGTTSSLSSSSLSSASVLNASGFICVLCVAIKKNISIYEINSNSKPKFKKLRDIEMTMMAQTMQIIDNQLCVGFQSEFVLYALLHEDAPIALLQPDRDKSLQFLIKDPINALMAIQVNQKEYLLVFENLGVYVNINGCRSRVEEIMWPSKPQHVAYNDPYLLCFSDRGIDVFNVKTGEWMQILQFPRTKPLDMNGSLCLCTETQDSIRLINLKATGEGKN
jgi:serine/threonine-protein kinase MRCK